MNVTSRGGRGSNQYRTTGSPVVPPGSSHAAVRAAVDTEDDPEEVAWAFHPQQQQWATSGFNSYQDAAPWMPLGLTPRRCRDWKDELFTPDEASAWIAVGLEHPMEPARWRSEGFTPELAHPWIREGKGSLQQVAWREAGFATVEAARPWDAIHVAPEAAAEYERCGITPGAVERWWNAYNIEVAQRLQWTRAGVLDPLDAKMWLSAKITPAGFERARQAGLTFDQVAAWARVTPRPWDCIPRGITDPQVAKQWETVRRGAPVQMSDSDWWNAARQWTNAGFSPVTAEGYIEAGVMHPDDRFDS